MSRMRMAAIAALVALLLALTPPRPALGIDLGEAAIIGVAVAGGLAAILLIAILIEGNREPDFLKMAAGSEPPRRADHRVRLGIGCPFQGGTVPLACW